MHSRAACQRTVGAATALAGSRSADTTSTDGATPFRGGSWEPVPPANERAAPPVTPRVRLTSVDPSSVPTWVCQAGLALTRRRPKIIALPELGHRAPADRRARSGGVVGHPVGRVVLGEAWPILQRTVELEPITGRNTVLKFLLRRTEQRYHNPPGEQHCAYGHRQAAENCCQLQRDRPSLRGVMDFAAEAAEVTGTG